MLTFEWDNGKAKANIRKHGIAFEEGTSVFGDIMSLTISDYEHSAIEEDRFITIGLSVRGRILVVSHCDRGDNIRIFSVRTATRRERGVYEKSY
ncbi:MAG: BrnT family toxin [Fibrobacteres bacterium]|nr:BrnT family toxin [Fibrobacterota bacterium]